MRHKLRISDYAYFLNNKHIIAEGHPNDLGGREDLMAELTESCDMEYFVQQIMNAFAFGAEYTLLALGLAMGFSIMGLVNFTWGNDRCRRLYNGCSCCISCTKSTDNYGGCDSVAMVASVTLERVAFRPVAI